MKPKTPGKHIRVAFVDSSDDFWTAGAQYLLNLWAAIRSAKSDVTVEIYLVSLKTKQSTDFSSLESYCDGFLDWPRSNKVSDSWFKLGLKIDLRFGIWLGPGPSIGSFLRSEAIDCVFAGGSLGPRIGIPMLSWFPDFQHLYLPEMFTQDQIRGRNKSIQRIAKRAERIIVSSQDAYKDLINLIPTAKDKTKILSFVAQIPQSVYETNPSELCKIYSLPERFVYLPNQFWKHKNHATVITALSTLKTQHPEVVVVCTGNTNDYRNPGYFGSLLSKISYLGLRDNLILLGFVPREHTYTLMRQSLAVLQPSLFEGWSTTVEEVKSLGKRIILSDIPIHREQNPAKAWYFDPLDPDELADCLVRLFGSVQAGPDSDQELTSRRQLPSRTEEFGRLFVDIVCEVVPK